MHGFPLYQQWSLEWYRFLPKMSLHWHITVTQRLSFTLGFTLGILLSMLLLLLLSRFSRVRFCDPKDGSPPGSPISETLQARTLEWVAISFSSAWKWKVKVKSLSRVRLLATPWTAAYQAPPSMGFSRQEYWSGVPMLSPTLSMSLDECIIKCIYHYNTIYRISLP